MIKNTFGLGLFISFLLTFSSVSFGYGMDCKKPTINPLGGSAAFTFDCKNTTDVTFGSYQIFPLSVSGATVTATACGGPIAPGDSCTVTGTFTTSTVGLYEIDFDDKYGGEQHYGIFCNNPEKGCIEVDVTTIIQVGDYLSSEGGVVFYVDPDPSSSGHKGLVVALTDACTGLSLCDWAPDNYNVTTSTDIYSGATNTDNMNAQTDGSQAATACLDYRGGNKADWYVPARDELDALYGDGDAATVNTVNATLATITGATQITTSGSPYYWSSSEYSSNPDFAWHVDFSSGGRDAASKDAADLVRCARAF